MKLIVLGATGLVGSNLLEMALADERVGHVLAPVRYPLEPHPKLSAPVINFRHLPDSGDFWKADAVVCALGTTMKKAGSRDAFRFADYTLPLEVARLARASNTPVWVLNSAAGACDRSPFAYNRIKAELELDLGMLGFPSLTLVRPGVISGNRAEFRAVERAMITGLRLVSPFISRRWHPVTAENIARTMLGAALDPVPGMHVVQSELML
ncbi:MAG: NAD-dependent dehydratase [Morganella morganii]